MSAAITQEDVRRVYERFDNVRVVQKDAQIEFVTMHFNEKDLKELVYMIDMLKAYMDAEVEGMNHDLISRDAVLDACSQSINILDAMSRIEDLPSVNAEPMRWHYDDFPPSDPEKRYVVVRTNELFVKPILDTADYYTGDGMYSEKPWHLDGGYSCYPSEILAWADVGEIGEIIKHISGKEQA